MTDLLIVLIVLAAIVLAAAYVIRAKKSGQACIGCPHAKACAEKHRSSCGCGCHDD